MHPPQAPAPLRIAYPPGLAPDKWLRRMSERHPGVHLAPSLVDVSAATIHNAPQLLRTAADIAFVREAATAPRSAPPGLMRIPLYEEAMAVLVPGGHEATLFTELAPDDLDGERWLDTVDPLTASSTEVEGVVELVAANVGVAQMPLALARSFSRRDVVVIPLTTAPHTRMGVCWLPERNEDEALEAFIGIVRGRTANTSRGEGTDVSAAARDRGRSAASTDTGRERGAQKAGGGRGRKPGEGARGTPRRRNASTKRRRR